MTQVESEGIQGQQFSSTVMIGTGRKIVTVIFAKHFMSQ